MFFAENIIELVADGVNMPMEEASTYIYHFILLKRPEFTTSPCIITSLFLVIKILIL